MEPSLWWVGESRSRCVNVGDLIRFELETRRIEAQGLTINFSVFRISIHLCLVSVWAHDAFSAVTYKFAGETRLKGKERKGKLRITQQGSVQQSQVPVKLSTHREPRSVSYYQTNM